MKINYMEILKLILGIGFFYGDSVVFYRADKDCMV